jgi:Na+/melibiose symporter-like transporter
MNCTLDERLCFINSLSLCIYFLNSFVNKTKLSKVEIFLKLHPDAMHQVSMVRSLFKILAEHNVFFYIKMLFLLIAFCGISGLIAVLFFQFETQNMVNEVLMCYARLWRYFNKTVRTKKHDPFQN